MSARILLQRMRPGLVSGAAGAGLGLLVLGPARLSRPLRMDARATPRQASTRGAEEQEQHSNRGGLSADLMRQLSGGSVAGKCSPLLLPLFPFSPPLFPPPPLLPSFSPLPRLFLYLVSGIIYIYIFAGREKKRQRESERRWLKTFLKKVASRYGIDLVRQLRLKERLGHSRVLAALEKDPAFKLSFGLFFTMSAFMQF
ncbi:hypothetical protein F5X96DRAFT_638739 [Biscogniauxia mediterranea]|nr:hypothetical protein F5X96DRAFT_638739 [Biscogniauxia mediterranea]